MDKTSWNALRRARKSAGLTQEKAAELAGYDVSTLAKWESGKLRASVEVLDILAAIYDARWLPVVYLRELSGKSMSAVVPEFQPGQPLSQAVMSLLDKVIRFGEQHSDRRLIALAADGKIDATEREEFDSIMEGLSEICKAAIELKFADGGHMRQPPGDIG